MTKSRNGNTTFRTATLLVVSIAVLLLVGCGSDSATGSDFPFGSDNPIVRPSRGTDPITGLPLPPSPSEKATSEALKQIGGAGVATGSTSQSALPNGSPSNELGPPPNYPGGDGSGATSKENDPIVDSDLVIGSIAPPGFLPPPTPPPTRPPTAPTTAGTPVTAPLSAPTTTTLAGQAVVPFLCDVSAVVTQSNGIRRLVVSIPAANRNVAWANIRWANSARNVSLDLSTGSGQTSLVVPSDELPDVFVFASPNRLASELGCSFTP